MNANEMSCIRASTNYKFLLECCTITNMILTYGIRALYYDIRSVLGVLCPFAKNFDDIIVTDYL